MKRFLSVTLVVLVVAALAGAALAQMGPGASGPMGMMGGAMGRGMMGQGMMGPGMMGVATGCPGMAAAGTPAATAQITEEKARELATQYTEKYLKGFTLERLLPFSGMHMAMYQAELKGPQGETRLLHINPWGGVMPFGGPVTR